MYGHPDVGSADLRQGLDRAVDGHREGREAFIGEVRIETHVPLPAHDGHLSVEGVQISDLVATIDGVIAGPPPPIVLGPTTREANAPNTAREGSEGSEPDAVSSQEK